ncbi:Lrp/AsnC family transcriptional regulator [Streptomyces sp. NPDC000941]
MATRVRRLESLQVITGYGARVDPVKAGWPVQAFVVLSTNGVRQSHQTAHIAQAAPHILEDHRVTGTDDHILRVVARDIGALEPLIDQLNELGKPATCFVLSSPKAWAPVPPPATSG